MINHSNKNEYRKRANTGRRPYSKIMSWAFELSRNLVPTIASRWKNILGSFFYDYLQILTNSGLGGGMTKIGAKVASRIASKS